MDRKLLKWWKVAWEATEGTNPMSASIDRELAKHGFSIVDLMNRIGMIGLKKEKDWNRDEAALMAFFQRANAVAEMALVDKCASGGMQGAMFLLKTKYRYRDGGQRDDVVSEEKKVISWGDQSVGAIDVEAEG